MISKRQQTWCLLSFLFVTTKYQMNIMILNSCSQGDTLSAAIKIIKGEIPLNNNNYRGYPQQRRVVQTIRNEDNCLNCCNYSDREKSSFPECYALAMAYVPFQQWGEIYPCEKALMRGTVFPCLDKPFLMGCCK